MPSPLDTIIRTVESAPDAIESAGATAEEVAAFLARTAASSVAGVGTEAEAVAIAGAADAATDLMLIGSLVWAIPVIIIVRKLFIRLSDALSRLPGPLKYVGWAIHPLLSQFDPVINWLENLGTNGARRIIDNHKVIWHTFNGLAPGQAGPPAPSAPSPPTTHPTHAPATSPDITKINTEITAINHEIANIEAALGQVQGHSAVPQSVWDQIHALEYEASRQVAAINWLADQNAQLHAQVNAQAHALEALSTEIHGLRTVTAGWQDIQQAQERQISTLTALYNHAEAQIHHNSTSIAQLAPLGLLLAPGIKGLRTLRQLEDTPCMCPKFGGIPNELGTALAVMEFVENG